MSHRCIVSVENRKFSLPIDQLDVCSLRQKLLNVSEKDPVLKNRIKKFSPLFYPTDGDDLELMPWDELTEGQHVTVRWGPLELEEDTGVNDPTTDQESQHVCSQSSSSTSDDAKGFQEPQLESLLDSSDTDYLNMVDNNINERNALMATIYPRKPDPPPRPKPKKTVAVASQEPLRRSSRVRKVIHDSDQENEDDNFMSFEETHEESVADLEVQPSPNRRKHTLSESSSSSVEANKENDASAQNRRVSSEGKKIPKQRHEYRKAEKKIRTIGQTICRGNALVKFSDPVKNALKKGEAKVDDVLPEIRRHIVEKTGDTYLKKKEIDLLCLTTVQKYKVLADPDTKFGFSQLKRSIQKSFSSHRYNKRNKAEFPNKTPGTARAATPETGPEVEPSSSGSILRTELQAGTAKKDRARWLIRKTYEERHNEIMMTDNKMEIINAYPHLRNTELLIYEYQLLIQMNEDVLATNIKKLLKTFSAHLHTPQHTIDNTLEILSSIQKKLLPKADIKKNIRMAITVKDAAEIDRHSLDAVNTEQAPCVVTTVTTNREGKRVLATSVLL